MDPKKLTLDVKSQINENKEEKAMKINVANYGEKTLAEILQSAELLNALGITTVTRTKVLNKTGVEYGDHSVSMTEGCYHGCRYCYDATCLGRFHGATYEDCCKPKLVADVLNKLDEELASKRNVKSAFLSFSGDPFPYGNSACHQLFHTLSFEVLKKVNDAGIIGAVLTKGTLPIELAEYTPKASDKKNYYGISLVSLDDEVYKPKYEPNAAPLAERLASLKALADTGKCKCFVSLEPFPVPSMIEGATEESMAKDLKKLLEELKFVDLVIFGRGNGINIEHKSLYSSYKGHREFYKKMAAIVKEWGQKNNVKIYVKRKVYEVPRRTKESDATAEPIKKAKLPKVELFV